MGWNQFNAPILLSLAALIILALVLCFNLFPNVIHSSGVNDTIIKTQWMNDTKAGSDLSPIPGGFKLKGVCNLHNIKEQKAIVDYVGYVKHGLHSSSIIPQSCMYGSTSGGVTQDGVQLIRHKGWKNINEIIESGNKNKILPVRSQASFYKSAFNHVCNKHAKRDWRRKNHVNCTDKEALVKLLQLNQQEISSQFSPYLSKEILMKSSNVRSIMLIDFKCLPKVVNSLCDEHMLSYENMTGTESNSAEGQNYTDFWAMHNYTPFTPFWDIVYKRLEKVCCLDFVKD